MPRDAVSWIAGLSRFLRDPDRAFGGLAQLVRAEDS